MKHIIKLGESIQTVIDQCYSGDTIEIQEGTYNEKIEINKDNLTLVGLGDVRINNDDHFYKIFKDHNFTNTFRTYTVMVSGNNVKFENLKIANTATPSSKYGQAVALHVIGNNFICNDCEISSAQDTLFVGPLPTNLSQKYIGFLPKYQLTQNESHQKYNNCRIVGDVDFIFGCATVLFENCTIVSLNTTKNSYISAPAHKKELPYGFLFLNCDLISNGAQNVFLSRPWRDYGIAAFINCKMGNHISPLGFANWDGTERYNTARFIEYSPNIDTSSRVDFDKILSKSEADEYTRNFTKYLNL